MFAGPKAGQPGGSPRLLARPDPQCRRSVRAGTTAAAPAAAAESPLLFVVGGVAGDSAPGGRGLHQVLVRAGSVLVEQAVQRLLVDSRLGKLHLVRKN
jgi:hypothetical protein